MKSLNDYIYERNISNVFDTEFLVNAFGERKYDNMLICEKGGSIPGHIAFCKKVAKILIDNLNNGIRRIAFSYDDLKKISGSDFAFFNVLIIDTYVDKTYEKISSGYEVDKDDADETDLSNLDKYTNRLNLLKIKIFLTELTDDIDTYVELLDHEFLHAYDDTSAYRRKSKFTLYRAMKTTGYEALVKKNDDDTEMDENVKTIIYLLCDIEKNAYISQFKTTLNDETYSDKNMSMEKIMNSPLYATYKLVKNNIRVLDQRKDKAFIEDFCNSYRKVTRELIEDIMSRNVNYEDLVKNINPNITNNKIIKKIVDRWERFEKKLYQHTKLMIESHYIPFTISSIYLNSLD